MSVCDSTSRPAVFDSRSDLYPNSSQKQSDGPSQRDGQYWVPGEGFSTALRVINLRDAGHSYCLIENQTSISYPTARRIAKRPITIRRSIRIGSRFLAFILIFKHVYTRIISIITAIITLFTHGDLYAISFIVQITNFAFSIDREIPGTKCILFVFSIPLVCLY